MFEINLKSTDRMQTKIIDCALAGLVAGSFLFPYCNSLRLDSNKHLF